MRMGNNTHNTSQTKRISSNNTLKIPIYSQFQDIMKFIGDFNLHLTFH